MWGRGLVYVCVWWGQSYSVVVSLTLLPKRTVIGCGTMCLIHRKRRFTESRRVVDENTSYSFTKGLKVSLVTKEGHFLCRRFTRYPSMRWLVHWSMVALSLFGCFDPVFGIHAGRQALIRIQCQT